MKLRLLSWRRSLSAAAAAVWLALPAAASGQSLRLASIPPTGTDIAAIEISLESPAGKAPTALQWEMTADGADVAFVQEAVPPSGKERPSGKSIHCAPKRSATNAKTSVCMLVGGLDPIPNGPIARVRLTGKPPAGGGRVRVRIEKAVAVYRDLSRVEVKPVELTIPAAR